MEKGSKCSLKTLGTNLKHVLFTVQVAPVTLSIIMMLSMNFMLLLMSNLILSSTAIKFGPTIKRASNNIIKKIGALSTSFLILSGAERVLANEVREVGSIATSGIIFKDTLKINAFNDPKVEGITIYLADFERPLTEKLAKDFFDDPSSTSLTCVQSGPIKLGDIGRGKDGEEVFEENRNLFFKVFLTKYFFFLNKPNLKLIQSHIDNYRWNLMVHILR
jgi:catabolite regulation protein CreA